MKHTKGPWNRGQTIGMRKLILTSENAIVAEIKTVGDLGMNANANLIAAAPEMLDALENLTERLSHLKNTNGVQDIIAKQLEDALKVIRKAKGIAGQSYPDEIKLVRELILKG